MTPGAIRMWTQRRPWSSAAACRGLVLAATAVAAAIHHIREGFLFAVFGATAGGAALRFAHDPGVDRASLFMRRR